MSTPQFLKILCPYFIVLAALAVLVLSGGVAFGQTAPLVSNIGRSDSTPASFASDYAQSFRTGSQAGGYKLTSVDIDFGVGDASGTEPTYTVSIINSSSGQPGTNVGTLTNPASLVAGRNSFTASGDGIDLAASTNYMVLVDVTTAGTKSITIKTTRSNDEDPGASTGWKIGDVAWTRSQGGSWSTQTEALKIAVLNSEATSSPPATPSSPSTPQTPTPSSPVTPQNNNQNSVGDSPSSGTSDETSQSQEAPVVTVQQVSLSRGACTVYSTSSHPYAGWPFLHFSSLRATISESTAGRSLGTLLTNGHTVRYSHLNNGEEVAISARSYCNDEIYHRHLVKGENVNCATLSPGEWTNIAFSAVAVSNGWCTRNIPRSSWG